uniref:Uncharacterized protein n=1 Tax=Trypanosoma congolense (strain IL3000) TaxID=1068625 RepID=G0ULW3_TRYCI|nr:hypothetical protein TCIL3000_5_3580 [Trypanosoma congolense IL3000]
MKQTTFNTQFFLNREPYGAHALHLLSVTLLINICSFFYIFFFFLSLVVKEAHVLSFTFCCHSPHLQPPFLSIPNETHLQTLNNMVVSLPHAQQKRRETMKGNRHEKKMTTHASSWKQDTGMTSFLPFFFCTQAHITIQQLIPVLLHRFTPAFSLTSSTKRRRYSRGAERINNKKNVRTLQSCARSLNICTKGGSPHGSNM